MAASILQGVGRATSQGTNWRRRAEDSQAAPVGKGEGEAEQARKGVESGKAGPLCAVCTHNSQAGGVPAKSTSEMLCAIAAGDECSSAKEMP